MKNIKRWIWVTFQRAGFHHYPTALTDASLSDVSYLGHNHRHLFKFKIQIEIFHDDREVEFHQFLNYCESLFDTNIININNKSVEMLSNDLHEHIIKKYPNRDIKINVSEDGECGCVIEYNYH